MYGNIGAADRLDFTVIGPGGQPHLAARGAVPQPRPQPRGLRHLRRHVRVRRLPLARDARAGRDRAAGRGVHRCPRRHDAAAAAGAPARLRPDARAEGAARQAQLVAVLERFGITCVLDVGANAGQYGALLREWGYRGRIVSFEPQAGAHAALERRAAADPAWQVAPRMALGERDGEVEIEVSAESDMSSILPQSALLRRVSPSSAVVGKRDGAAPASRRRRRTYLNADDRVFLKIDTQGYEAEVLAGAGGCSTRLAGIQLEMSLVPLLRGRAPFSRPCSMISPPPASSPTCSCRATSSASSPASSRSTACSCGRARPAPRRDRRFSAFRHEAVFEKGSHEDSS